MDTITPRRIVYSIVALFLCLALIIGGAAGCKSYSRYQKRADANNNVRVTNINVRRAIQQARIVAAQDATIKARADQRVIAARGLAKSQQIVQRTLTPLYVQFEAIEAQKEIATSGKNNTVIYVPAGTNGTPVITQGADAKTGSVGTP